MDDFMLFVKRNENFYCLKCKAYDITTVNSVCFWCKNGYYPLHGYDVVKNIDFIPEYTGIAAYEKNK